MSLKEPKRARPFSDEPFSREELAARHWTPGEHPMTDAAFAYARRLFENFEALGRALFDEFDRVACQSAEGVNRQITLAETAAIAARVFTEAAAVPREPEQKPVDCTRDIYGSCPDTDAPTAAMRCGSPSCNGIITLTTRNLVLKGKVVLDPDGKPVRTGCFPALVPIPDQQGNFQAFAEGGRPLPLCPRCADHARDEVARWNAENRTAFKLRFYSYQKALTLISGAATAPIGAKERSETPPPNESDQARREKTRPGDVVAMNGYRNNGNRFHERTMAIPVADSAKDERRRNRDRKLREKHDGEEG